MTKTSAALVFSDADLLGRVAAVDTSRVLVVADDPAIVTRVGVGNLVGVCGATEREYLIGIVERVRRSLREEMLEEEDAEGETPLDLVADDVVRIVLVGTYRTVYGDKKNVFKRGADSFPQIERTCYLITGANLQRFMGLLGAEVKEGERLELGKFVMDESAVVVANGDKFFQRHASILGSTGSGKSWSVALMLEKASRLANPNIVVLDMHGEYEPLADAKKGFARGFRIAGPGDLEKPDDSVVFLPYWLLNREEMLSMILDRSDQNAPNQASRFTSHVRELKEETLKKETKEDVRKTFTVDSPIPYDIATLVEELQEDNARKGVGAKGQPVKGLWEDKLTRFIARLDAKMEDRRYGFLFQPPSQSLEYNWLGEQMKQLLGASGGRSGIKIVDFSEVPSDVLPVVAGVFVRLLYDVQFWLEQDARTPYVVVCDEAHLYLPARDDANAVEKQALSAFERIAKEGRKYGVSLLVVSQRPSDVSRTILSQCNNFLVLRLTNAQDQAVVRRLVPDSLGGITDILPLLETGEGLLLGDAVLLPTRIRLDKPTIRPASVTRAFWTEWGLAGSTGEAIAKAVETLRSQTRPSAAGKQPKKKG